MSTHRGYLHLHKADCFSFRNFEDFCRERKPWGLGYDLEVLNRIVEERLERQRQERLENVPEANHVAGPGRGRKKKENQETDYQDVNPFSASRSVEASRLRAIKRVPPIVGYLYENNLLGEVEASKLGLLNPSPERSQQIDEIVRDLKELRLPSDALQKRLIKCQANALVNKKLGTTDFKVIDDPRKAANTLAKKFQGDRLRQLIDFLQQIRSCW